MTASWDPHAEYFMKMLSLASTHIATEGVSNNCAYAILHRDRHLRSPQMKHIRHLRTTMAAAVTIGIAISMLMPLTASAGDIAGGIDLWWPVPGAMMSGTMPFKALVPDRNVWEYQMVWAVDGGQRNPMADSWESWPHKEAWVNFDGWTWKGYGPYTVTFTALDRNGVKIAERSISIYANGKPASTISPTPTPVPAPSPSPTPTPSSSPTPSPSPSASPVPPSTGDTPTATPSSSPAVNLSNPLAGYGLWVNPQSDPARWVRDHLASDPINAALMQKIASQPEVQWFGNWNNDVQKDVTSTVTTITNAGKLPVFVVYNIPQRDCGGYSAGGSGSPDAYKSWIRSIAAGLNGRKAAVIVEPDALAAMDCLSSADQETRIGLIKYAIQTLTKAGAVAYIDAGHSAWKSPADTANRLKQAGIDQAAGFSLNVSNFRTTDETTAYATQISALTGGKHFVMDTGRNGNGPAPDNQWCNPWGRALGAKPTTNTSQAITDAYLWVRGPSGSDGQCNGGPSAGTFWPEYGLDLAKNTSW